MCVHKTMIGVLLFIAATAAVGNTESVYSPYKGEENREIKSLSGQMISDYTAGRGMGLAKAAELNHYPGPKHVLELADRLQLSAEQIKKSEAIHDQMLSDAVRLGRLIIEQEKLLDDLFAGQKAIESEARILLAEIGRLQGELRFAHLRSHIQMKALLLPGQVTKYDALRGYSAAEEKPCH